VNVSVAGSGPRGHDCGPRGDLGALQANGEAGRHRDAYEAPDVLYWGDIPAVWCV